MLSVILQEVFGGFYYAFLSMCQEIYLIWSNTIINKIKSWLK